MIKLTYFTRTHRLPSLQLIVLSFTLLFTSAANAEIYLCKEKTTYYTDMRCADGQYGKKVVLGKPKGQSRSEQEQSTGYELFLGPKRIGHEPEWTLAQSIEHLRWYTHKNATTAKARAYYNAVEIILNSSNQKRHINQKTLKLKPNSTEK